MLFRLKDYRIQRSFRHLSSADFKGKSDDATVLRRYNIVGPSPHSHRTSKQSDLLDSKKQKTLSTLVWEHGYCLVELVELVRGQTQYDRRPKKALCPQHYGVLLKGYRHQRLLQSMADEGILPRWHSSVTHQCRPPPSHHSKNRHLAAVAVSIRKGHDAGQYLVLDEDIASLWPHVLVSPFRAVPKKDVGPSIEVRLIHDLSFPKGRSTNDASDKTSFPNAKYTAVAAVVRRIGECARRHPGVRICIAKGGVNGVFRHLMLASKTVCWMGGRLPEQHALIIDMSAPFGWSGSSPFYSAFGGAI
ncbi:hypothetical protein PHMEG_00018116 [Phytophthora megakarya]|uniref:Uncharacterized protein n=1 Tax=Phytophthora megakarya TaxID=4795 RepID=A0A225VW51_9STRA|nr:hypothetical protein PHMEG_00018116 [Phytophthora megakarya]